MPGGLLNIVAMGNQNIILNGNPSKTFFKSVYHKYTNFGLQKFRVDFDGQKDLRLNDESKFTFKIPRYAELLLDSYIVVTLPSIWSPIIPPPDTSSTWHPYEFKWIKNLGTQMIKEIEISIGGGIIQKYSGQYLYNIVERDFEQAKKKQYYEMTGNTDELNDPANAGSRVNQYPNAYYNSTTSGSEPSIRGRKLYIPLNCWFSLSSKMAFPLVSLQYNELKIEVTFRPIKELFIIRDVTDTRLPYVQPNFNIPEHNFYRFTQQPPDIALTTSSYQDKSTNWNADVHMISTYAFLSNEEAKVFASKEQKYLLKEIQTHHYKNIVGPQKLKINTLGMISSWMWYLNRNDNYLRNEWSNYTNWPYDYLPYEISAADESGDYAPSFYPSGMGPGYNPNTSGATGIYITGNFEVSNQKDILSKFGILLDGKYRETEFDAGVYNYIEKYSKSNGNSPNGLYCYNFSLNTNPYDFQPSGAMNLSKFKHIEMEFTTYVPPFDLSAQTFPICSDGEIIGSNKDSWIIYDYTFDLTLFEEKYNILQFTSGTAALVYSR
tara:strand:- start:43 stop:1686 length:1644 start_codon:yes stop_codon:yes gene_type:complete